MEYVDEEKAIASIPTLRMLLQKPEEIRVRANTIARRLKKEIQNAHIKVMADSSRAGGGSLPERDLPTFVTAVKPDSISVNELEEILRKGTPPVITRIKEDTLVLDARTIRNNDIATLVQRIKSALS
jgi:L-seryl-tRNA(Ser) seleniumtransferase